MNHPAHTDEYFLGLAIEQAKIGWEEGGVPIGSHFSPANKAYVDLTGTYPHDIAKAKEITLAMIERGADVNRPNDKNQTPLAGAVFKGEDAVVKALVSGGADPKGGHPTAVDAARMFGREDYLSLLES